MCQHLISDEPGPGQAELCLSADGGIPVTASYDDMCAGQARQPFNGNGGVGWLAGWLAGWVASHSTAVWKRHRQRRREAVTVDGVVYEERKCIFKGTVIEKVSLGRAGGKG